MELSVFDHGLLYGDGVFEGIRAYNGRIFKLERHLERLFHSAKAIDLKIPHTKEEMANLILETCRRNDIREGYIRPVITRGKGDLGLDPRKCKSGPSVVVIAQPGISLYGADEALMLDIHGYVSEATAENFFIVRNSTIVTPWTSTNLPGVTRETVLELVPQLGLKADDRRWQAGTDDEEDHEGVPGPRDDDGYADRDRSRAITKDIGRPPIGGSGPREVPRIQGEGDLRPLRHPHSTGGHRIETGRHRRSAPPLHGQGTGPRRRTRKGRRNQARGDARRSPLGRRADPQHGHPRVSRERGVPRGAAGHRTGALPRPHDRSIGPRAAPHGQREGRDRHRGGPARPDLHGAHPGGRRDPTVRPPESPETTRASQGNRRPVRIRRPERL